MVFHWRLSDGKSPQVFRILLSILAVFNNAVVWMVSTRPPTSKSSRPFNNPLVTVPKAPITIGIIVTFMFHSFFNFLARSRYLSLFSHSFSFILWSASTAKSTNLQIFFSFFLLIIIKSGLLAEIRWSIGISKSHRSLCVSFLRTGAGLCIYHLLAWSNVNFLHISQWITLPTLSYLALYPFCANLLHSLIMWLMVSSLSPHSLHLLFCCVLFILALIWLVLMALFCAAIRRNSVSLLKFPFLSLVQVLSYYYYYYYYYLLLESFSHQRQLTIFHWGLSASKSPQVSRTLLSILAVLNNAVVWMVSTRPPVSKSSSPFNSPLVTIPRAPIKIGKIVTVMFHSFFQFPNKVEVSILLLAFTSILLSDQPRQQSSQSCKFSFFYWLS